MLCSLLKIWSTYSIANAVFPSYGKMFSNQADEPVAMMMSYRHRDVTIVNQKEFIHCFTTEIANKANVPIVSIAPDMFKFTTLENDSNFDHYVFFDKNADIKLPPKAEENKSVHKITKQIENFSETHKKNAKVVELVKKISGRDISVSMKKRIRDMVRQIVKNEHAKDEYRKIHNHTSIRLKKTLKKEIKNLVNVILRIHHNRVVTNTRIRNILSIVNKINKKDGKKDGNHIKRIIQSIIKMNAHTAITPKKIARILTIVRSYPKDVADKKIKHLIQTVIRTRSNSALTKHTINKMIKYVRSQSGKSSETKIEEKIRKMFKNVVDTTVSTIVPRDKIISIIYTASKPISPRIATKKIKNIIHDIRVDDDIEDNDSCPVCKCNFKPSTDKPHARKHHTPKPHARKHKTISPKKALSIAEVVKLIPSNRLVDNSVVKKLAKSKNIGKKGKKVVKKGKKVVKKGKKVTKKLILKRTIKMANKKINLLKKKDLELKKNLKGIVSQLKKVETKEKFEKLVSTMKKINRKRNLIKKVVAKLNVVKFDSKQKQFALSPVGVKAVNACKKIGATGVVLKGCLQDIRLSRNPTIILTAVKKTIATLNQVKKANKIQRVTGNAPSRSCSAVGDPHFTNFNGDYFHIQQPSIYTFAKTSDGLFEVQVKQSGSTGAGTPSYVNDVMIRYDGQVYHGSFNKDGFKVSSGGYVSVTVPGSYQGEMVGICGVNGLSAGAQNFILPSGKLADVNYGQRNWQLGGYGGPNTKLSKWHLSWRPSMQDCMFSKSDCANNLKDQVGRKYRFVSTPWGRIDTSAM